MRNEFADTEEDRSLSESTRYSDIKPTRPELDDRELKDYLKYCTKLAEQFNYFDFNLDTRNDEGEPWRWKDFFESDNRVWAAGIDQQDVRALTEQFSRMEKNVREIDIEEEIPGELAKLQEFLKGISKLLNDRLNHYVDSRDASGLKEKLKFILNQFQETNEAESSEGSVSEPTGNSNREKVFRELSNIQKSFANLISGFNQLTNFTEDYLKSHPLDQQQFPPHLALFICFLRLFDLLRKEFNGLLERHLNFYYRTVLEFGPRAELADKIHMVFDLDENYDNVLLATGEELLAEIPGLEQLLNFRVKEDTGLSHAKISALETIYIKDEAVFRDNQKDLLARNKQVYKGVYPCPSPENWAKDISHRITWPLFGEDQSEMGASERTMQFADTGLSLASPLFYLPEGSREVTIRFDLDNLSYGNLSDYIVQYAKGSADEATRGKKIDEDASEWQLLKNAFLLDFTAPDGWQTILQERVRTMLDGKESIVMILKWKQTDKAFSGYIQKIHGPGPETSLPMLRIMINNNNAHNAYSYLRGLIVKRIQIRVNTEGFRNVTIRNNVGLLSQENPFQLFGPQPFAGSFIDFRNSNVFNQFTTSFALCFEWLELPQGMGGFREYFKSYHNQTDNSSFKVGISSISGGRPVPAQEDQQQQFNLFQDAEDDSASSLSDKTIMENINLRKLEFLNMPAMQNDNKSSLFENGAVRIQLQSPPSAFGHLDFPKIFADTALHNSKRFSSKRELPNPPYTPKLKSVMIDYCLEHAESFNNKPDGGEKMSHLEIFHYYPSGYKKIYPSDTERSVQLVPDLGERQNLYIGLTNLSPDEELSMLFQLEERNFHHTLHKTPDIKWSHLFRNEWRPIPSTDIVQDTTENFIGSGVIKIKIPSKISAENTMMPSGSFWLRVALSGQEDFPTHVFAIFTNAVICERVLSASNALNKENMVVLPGAVKSFSRKVAGIRNLWQLFPSFSGRLREDETQLNRRAAERLRHKQRLLTSTDIEQFVLQNFQSISVVKCVGLDSEGYSPVYPGVNAHVIVVPKQRADGLFDSVEPKVSLGILLAIKSVVLQYCSPFFHLEVGNPVYEKVKLSGNICFNTKREAEYGYYLKKLDEDIRKYFCPWLFVPGTVLKIGGRIYLSHLLNYLKKLPYVRTIAGFSAIHFFDTVDNRTGEPIASLTDTAKIGTDQKTRFFLKGSVPEAILIPSEQHLFVAVPEPLYTDPGMKGIGDFILGEELLIVAPLSNKKKSNTKDDEDDEYFDLSFAVSIP